MKFLYEDLISGDCIFLNGVGHLRSPKLKELKPSEGIGITEYNLFLAIVSWDIKDFLDIVPSKHAELINKSEKLTIFDMITILKPEFREALSGALNFFICETVIWDDKNHCYLVVRENKLDKSSETVGKINRENYEIVKNAILQLNYIGTECPKDQKFVNKRAKELWELTQKQLKEESRKNNDKSSRIGNIVSKLCAANIGYTYLNIYELTIYQLYDVFFQYGFLRAMDLNENAFATHGGEKFNFQQWLKPIADL